MARGRWSQTEAVAIVSKNSAVLWVLLRSWLFFLFRALWIVLFFRFFSGFLKDIHYKFLPCPLPQICHESKSDVFVFLNTVSFLSLLLFLTWYQRFQKRRISWCHCERSSSQGVYDVWILKVKFLYLERFLKLLH